MQGKWEYIVFCKTILGNFLFSFFLMFSKGWSKNCTFALDYCCFLFFCFCLLLSCISWCKCWLQVQYIYFFFCPIGCFFSSFLRTCIWWKGFWMFWSLCQWIVWLMVKGISVWCYCSKWGHDAMAFTITEKYVFEVTIIAAHIL